MELVERVEAMEKRMGALNEVMDAMAKALEQLEAARDEYQALSDYYGSQAWFDDAEAANNGTLPESVQCGVLTEDLPYDALNRWNDLGFQMIEAGLASARQR